MVFRDPLPIEIDERFAAPGAGIETPGDLAPCLVQPEIWVRGHAFHPPAPGARSLRVRLALARDATLLISKNVTIPVPDGPFIPPFIHAFAPLSRTWPIRARLLGGLDPAPIERSPADLPNSFDWSYFQAAPQDQRVGPLRGDEWLRLEGIHREIEKFDTRLPSAWGAVVMFGQTEPFRQGQRVRVGLDTIEIHSDLGTCSLVFRGYVPLPPGESLESIQIAAGIGLPDRPPPKLEPLGVAARTVQRPSSMPPPPSSRDHAAETMRLDQAMLARIAQQKVMPFESDPPSRPISQPPPPSLLRPLPQPQPLPQPHPVSATIPDVDVTDVEGTFMLSEAHRAQLVDKPVMPFAGGLPAPERLDSSTLPKVLPFEPAAAEPATLGAFFLAAMAAAQHAPPH